MLHAEHFVDANAPYVRFTGSNVEVSYLQDGIAAMVAGSRAAEAGGTPFAYTPEEAIGAREEWMTTSLVRGGQLEVRRVSVMTGVIAYRGLVYTHARLAEGAAIHGVRGTDVLSSRRHQMHRAIGELADLAQYFREAGYIEPAPIPRGAE